MGNFIKSSSTSRNYQSERGGKKENQSHTVNVKSNQITKIQENPAPLTLPSIPAFSRRKINRTAKLYKLLNLRFFKTSCITLIIFRYQLPVQNLEILLFWWIFLILKFLVLFGDHLRNQLYQLGILSSVSLHVDKSLLNSAQLKPDICFSRLKK